MTTPWILDQRFIIKNICRGKVQRAASPGRLRYPVPMSTASEHYAHHLGPVYSWMVGDPETASMRATLELDIAGLAREAEGAAIDLGAGFGLHALLLARRGYSVLAVDSCQTLLSELDRQATGMPIRTIA